MVFKPKIRTTSRPSLQNEVEKNVYEQPIAISNRVKEQPVPIAPQIVAEKKIDTPKFVIADLVTETAPIIKDNITGDTYDVMSALIWIMNKLSEFEEE